MSFKIPSVFEMSDDLFFRIFFIFSLIVGGSLIFYSFEYSLKKESNTIEKTNEIEIDKQDNLGNLKYVNCDSPVWKRKDKRRSKGCSICNAKKPKL